jgi:8-oxo-dGTP pyrophosphatase MutT (NUDIX family)/2'-5' RNA ligase
MSNLDPYTLQALPSKIEKSADMGARVSALRFALSGGAPGFWAFDHLKELQHMTGWNFPAVHAFGLQLAGARRQVFYQPPAKNRRRRMPDDPIKALEWLEERKSKQKKKAFTPADEGDNTKKRPVPDSHPLAKLLKKPNPDQSGAVFYYQMGQQLALTGGCIEWTVRDNITTYDKRGTTRERYIIPTGLAIAQQASAAFPFGSYRVQPIGSYALFRNTDADDWFSGAVGTLMMMGGTIDARNIRIIGWPHPLYVNDFASAMTAGSVQIDIAEAIDNAIWARMKNQASPGLLYQWESQDAASRVRDEDMVAFRADVRSRNSGTANTGKDMLVPPGLKAEHIDYSPKEMDYANSRPQARDGVFAMHQTPGVVAGITDAGSYSQYYASLRQFTDQKVQPNVELIAEEETEDLCPAFGPGYTIEGKAKSIEDPAIEAQKMQRKLMSGAYTNDEYRAFEGDPPHPDPEVGKAPAGKPPQPQGPGGAGGPGGPGGAGPGDGGLPGGGDPTGGIQIPALGDATDTGTPNPTKQAVTGRADVLGKSANLDAAAKPTEPEHKYASTQIEFAEPLRSRILSVAAAIPATDLGEEGREDTPHVTVRYGLITDDPQAVIDVAKSHGPITVKLGKTSLFTNPEADVLKLEVASDGLYRLNEALKASIPHTDKYPLYVPHVTLAYLKPGAGGKYVGWAGLDGETATINELIFSDRNRNRVVIPLRSTDYDLIQKSLLDFDWKSFDESKHPRADDGKFGSGGGGGASKTSGSPSAKSEFDKIPDEHRETVKTKVRNAVAAINHSSDPAAVQQAKETLGRFEQMASKSGVDHKKAISELAPQPPADQAENLSKARKAANDADLNDAMRTGSGVNPDKRGIDKKVADQFDAHGVSSLDGLASLLNKGVDPARQFFSAPLSSAGKEGYGTTLKGSSPLIVMGHPGKTIKEGGIAGVLVDDNHASAIPHLQKAFPHVKFVAAADAAETLKKVAPPNGTPVSYKSKSLHDTDEAIESSDLITKSLDPYFGRVSHGSLPIDSEDARKKSLAWLQAHGGSELAIQNAAYTFLMAYTTEFQAALQQLAAEGRPVTPKSAAALINVPQLAERYKAAILPAMTAAAVDGAKLELQTFAPGDAGIEAVNQKAAEESKKLYGGDFWKSLAENLRDRLVASVVVAAATSPVIAVAFFKLVSDVAAKGNKASANALGTTGATNALGSGQDVARDSLVAMGINLRKQWVCMMDGRERPTHHIAHGQIVPYNGKFVVGGHQCDFPGDETLPIEETINCRCHAVTIPDPSQPAVKTKALDLDELMLTKGFTGTVNAKNGATYHYVDGHRVAAHEFEEKKKDPSALEQKAKPTKEQSKAAIDKAVSAPHELTHDDIAALPDHFANMNMHELRAYKKQLAASGSSAYKEPMVEAIHAKIAAGAGAVVTPDKQGAGEGKPVAPEAKPATATADVPAAKPTDATAVSNPAPPSTAPGQKVEPKLEEQADKKPKKAKAAGPITGDPTAEKPVGFSAEAMPEVSYAATPEGITGWDKMGDLPPGKQAYGAVVLRTDPATGKTQVLLREPKDHFDSYVWTWPKGKRDDNAISPADVAHKELGEETGYSGKIAGHLPQMFGSSGVTKNAFFVMAHDGKEHDPSKMDGETASTKWVDLDKAHELIGQTTKIAGRQRDLDILESARKFAKQPTDPKIGQAADKVGTIVDDLHGAGDYSPKSLHASLHETLQPLHPETIAAVCAKHGVPNVKALEAKLSEALDVASEFPGFPGSPAAVTEIKGLGGSTGAKLVAYKGNSFVMKRGNNPDHIREEHAADSIYSAMDVPVPKAQLHETPGGPVKIAEHLGDAVSLQQYLKTATPAQKEAVNKQLRQHFVLDALLGNWDVIGAGADNVMVDKAGKAWRIDNGGSMRYRAQGEPKSSQQWSDSVDEINTMRDPKTNPQAASVFGGISKKEIADQVQHIVANKQKILDAAPDGAREMLRKRIDHLAEFHGSEHGITQVKGSIYLGHGTDWASIKPHAGATLKPASNETNHPTFRPLSENEPRKTVSSSSYAPSFTDHMNAALKTATSPETKATTKYTGSGYSGVNSRMRDCPETLDCLDSTTRTAAKHIESAIAKGGTFESPVNVWRNPGIQSGDAEGKKFLAAMAQAAQTGDAVRMPGFKSTSMSPSTSMGGGDIKLEIRAKSGLWVQPISMHQSEKELIQGHNTRYRVVSVKDAKDYPGSEWGIGARKVIQLEEI